jgi:monofunctional biosynthetic peptidoglycan transglycosylase
MPPAPPRSRIKRLVVWAAAALLAVVLLPYLLTPLYRVGRPISTLMLWRWGTGARVERVWTPLEAISPALPITVMISEDARFCAHRGIDWQGLRASFEDADDPSDLRGGSTITQQVVKNLFLWHGRSYLRKVLELPLALWVDLVLSKRRIIEIYLNIAEWGPNGQFGAGAAAKYAFGKDADTLSAREAALLAAVLPNPMRRSARRPGPAVRRLAGIHEARARASPQSADCILTRGAGS